MEHQLQTRWQRWRWPRLFGMRSQLQVRASAWEAPDARLEGPHRRGESTAWRNETPTGHRCSNGRQSGIQRPSGGCPSLSRRPFRALTRLLFRLNWVMYIRLAVSARSRRSCSGRDGSIPLRKRSRNDLRAARRLELSPPCVTTMERPPIRPRSCRWALLRLTARYPSHEPVPRPDAGPPP
jgi:hypothetical protein